MVVGVRRRVRGLLAPLAATAAPLLLLLLPLLVVDAYDTLSEAQTALRANLLEGYDKGAIPPTNNISEPGSTRGNEYPFDPLRP